MAPSADRLAITILWARQRQNTSDAIDTLFFGACMLAVQFHSCTPIWLFVSCFGMITSLLKWKAPVIAYQAPGLFAFYPASFSSSATFALSSASSCSGLTSFRWQYNWRALRMPRYWLMALLPARSSMSAIMSISR